MGKIICTKCGSKQLIAYENLSMIREYKITKDGKRSKKYFNKYWKVDLNNYGIYCSDCGQQFHYVTDIYDSIIKMVKEGI